MNQLTLCGIATGSSGDGFEVRVPTSTVCTLIPKDGWKKVVYGSCVLHSVHTVWEHGLRIMAGDLSWVPLVLFALALPKLIDALVELVRWLKKRS